MSCEIRNSLAWRPDVGIEQVDVVSPNVGAEIGRMKQRPSRKISFRSFAGIKLLKECNSKFQLCKLVRAFVELSAGSSNMHTASR